MLQTFPKSVSHIRNCIWQYFINWKLTCKNIFEWWVNPARRSCWDEMNARKLPVSMLPSDSWLIVTVVAPSEVGTKDYSWDRRESVKIVFNAWQGGKFNLYVQINEHLYQRIIITYFLRLEWMYLNFEKKVLTGFKSKLWDVLANNLFLKFNVRSFQTWTVRNTNF